VRVKVQSYAAACVDGYAVEVQLLDAARQPVSGDTWRITNGKSQSAGQELVHELVLAVSDPAKWSAEQPELYTLLLTLRDADGDVLEVERANVGFRKVEIEDGKILINGVPVTF